MNMLNYTKVSDDSKEFFTTTMSHLGPLVISFVLIITNPVSLLEDYCWKEYTGEIPADAVVGGHDENGNKIYIGQAYTEGVGLIPVEIHAGVTEVVVPLSGNLREVEDYTKILCGPKDDFYWVPATRRNLHSVLNGKHAVIGGHVEDRGRVNVGRVQYRGETKIGRIETYDSGYLYFHGNGNKRKSAGNYEVLMYRSGSTRTRSMMDADDDLNAQIADIFNGL